MERHGTRPRITYYVATSLDGFIATPDGGVDWLSCTELDGEDYGYSTFIGTVDGLLMGRATFDFATSHPWPYGDRPCWVWTHQELDVAPPTVRSTEASPTAFIRSADLEGLDHLWLVGGGRLASAFEGAGLIDEYVLTYVPVTLGTGVPLLGGSATSTEPLVLDRQTLYSNGVFQAVYRRPLRSDG